MTTIIQLDGLRVHLGEPHPVTHSVSHGWFPGLARFPAGELLLTYSLTADTNENALDISGVMFSTDQGQNWSQRYDLVPEHQPMIYLPQSDGALFALPAYLFADAPEDKHHFHGAAMRFEQGGRRIIFEPGAVRLVDWPFPIDILPNPYRANYHRVNFCFDGDALRVGGRLLATLYGTAAGDALMRVVVASSTDDGYTWRYLSTVAGPEATPTVAPRGHGPAEPTMIQLEGGDLMCVMRMGSGAAFPLRRSYSRDEGRTWSPPEAIPPYSVEPSMKRLANGVIALSTGRPGIYLWFSTDNRGANWQSLDLLEHHNRWAPDATYRITTTQTTAYTELLEVAPNQLLLAYDRIPFGWKPTPANSGEHNRLFLLPIEVQRPA